MCDIYFPAFAKTIDLCSSYPVATTDGNVNHFTLAPFAIESRFGFRAKKHLHYFNCTLGEYFILVPYGVRL